MFWLHINIKERQPGKCFIPEEVFGSPAVFLVRLDCMFVALVKKNGNSKVCCVRIEENGERWLSGYEGVAAVES